MAATVATREYQAAQVALRALTYRDVTRLWPLLDLTRLDVTFPVFAAAVVELVRTRRVASESLALAYLSAMRTAAGVLSDPPVVERPVLPVPVLLASLRSSSVISVKSAMQRKTALELASRNALVRTMGTVDKFVGDGGREVIRASVQADPAAKGWIRRTLGTCSFCASEAAGDNMKSGDADFPRHDHCGCQPEPVFEGSDATESSLLTFTPGAVNPGITAAEQAALREYQLNGFKAINGALRGRVPATAETKALTAELDRVLDRSTLTADTTLFRGYQNRKAGMEVGDEFNDAGFMSTSLDDDFISSVFADPEVLKETLDDVEEYVESVVVHMQVPKGTHALKFDSTDPFYAAEKEVLLHRNSTFRIVREQPGVPGESPTILWAELVP